MACSEPLSGPPQPYRQAQRLVEACVRRVKGSPRTSICGLLWQEDSCSASEEGLLLYTPTCAPVRAGHLPENLPIR
eukprot:1158310-Pelagomonas_calceolata.AAC.3